MSKRSRFLRVCIVLIALAVVCSAQNRRYRSVPNRPIDRGGVPEWDLDHELPKDVFTFVRIKYQSYGRWGWPTDYPDAELNLSYRLQQLTSMKVHPEGRVIELTDKELFDHPFIYIVEPGGLIFSEEEVVALRQYLHSGGFLWVDDFWGERQWQNLYEQLKRVLPEPAQEPQELEMSHPVFHAVFPLKLSKQEMQIPNFMTGERSKYSEVTWEYHDGEECRDVHLKGIFDERGRMMVFISHNTDNGDGWEREGEFEYYFREFSEKKAYPLAINVLFYTMTH